MSWSPVDAGPAPRGRWRRLDSLFARALLTQTLVAICLLVLFGALLYLERSISVGRLVGERWAPALRQAAGWPAGGTSQAPPVLRSNTRPPLAVQPLGLAPRLKALEAELRQRGVPIFERVIAPGPNGPALWVQVTGANGDTVWLGVTDDALLPNLAGRLLPAVLIALLLLVSSSWVLMRRLTRPLERLRARMQAHEPGVTRPEAAAQATDASPEIAAIEAAYDDLLARFEEHQRERTLLLAGVSHDLRSPIARIRMAAELLPDARGVAPRREAIVRNAALLERLVQSFLDHVRAGELALDQVVDAAEIARVTAARLDRGAGELSIEVPASLHIGATHPLLIERLLANLLDNAFVHGRPPVRVRMYRQAGDVVIEVHDSGPGIAAEHRPQVIQAFARGDASRGTPGTGLGLAIIDRVVKRMGGTLAFEQRPGGHCACITLPGAVSG